MQALEILTRLEVLKMYHINQNMEIVQAVLQNVSKAQIKVKTKNDNVAGVNLPVFESYQDGADSYELAGLAKGGQQLKRMKANYQKAINLLVELASLQTSFITLDEVIKTTNRRVNAIEHVIIPRIERTLAYIISELGEFDFRVFILLMIHWQTSWRGRSSTD